MISSTLTSEGMLIVFGDSAGDERLYGAHHFRWPHVVDRAAAVLRLEGAVEHGQIVVAQMRRAFDRLVLLDVLHDVLDLLHIVAEALSARGTGVIDDLQAARRRQASYI
jgi:hypothetical protein